VSVEVGAPAPRFTLRDQYNQPLSLADFAGDRNVLLVFFPAAFTTTCQGELAAIQDRLDRLQNDEVQVLGVSVDSPYAHRVWAQREGFTFPLLSDFWPHGAVAEAYGCFDAVRGRATRGSYLIDRAGILRWQVHHDVGPRDIDGYVAALAEV
jgi:peroxiredoxin